MGKPSREAVLAWMAEHGCGAKAAHTHFRGAYTVNQINGWRRRGHLPQPPEKPAQPHPSPKGKDKGEGGGTSPPRPGPVSRGGAPAATLSPDDRELALQLVRDARWIAAACLTAKREAMERGEPVSYDAREAQALLNYQRMASEVIEAHPGLLELAHGTDAGGVGGGGAAALGDALDRVREGVRELRHEDEG